MPRPVHFEIHASDPKRAAEFYTTVFGWKIDKWDGPIPYWTVGTGEGRGIDGGLVQRRGDGPEEGAAVNAFPVTIDVPDLDAALAAVDKAGGMLALPKESVPGVGLLAYVKDTEGNLFGMLQPERPAR